MISAVIEHPGTAARATATNHDEAETAPVNPHYGRALDYISASRLNCWQQCRRKHYFRYVADIPSKPSPAMHLGKVVHATLQQWNLWRWDKIPFTRSDLIRAFLQSWRKELSDNPVTWKSDTEHRNLRKKAWELVSTYLATQVINEGEDIAGVEVRLEAKLEGLPPIIGIVDLVRDGGRIVDFKTAAKSPSESSIAHVHGTQLAIYALLYRHCTGAIEGGLELHHLVKTKVPKVCVSEIDSLGDREIVNVIELLHRYINAVMAEDYTASPSFMCAGCEHLERCKQWPDSRGKGEAS